jgi:hypothetical protein
MKSGTLVTCFALATAAGAAAGVKPVAFRLATLPASTEPGQKLVLCAANIGTGTVDVTTGIHQRQNRRRGRREDRQPGTPGHRFRRRNRA